MIYIYRVTELQLSSLDYIYCGMYMFVPPRRSAGFPSPPGEGPDLCASTPLTHEGAASGSLGSLPDVGTIDRAPASLKLQFYV